MSKPIKTNFFYKLYLNLISSIALFPSIISVVLFSLSLLTLRIDHGLPDLMGYDVTPAKGIIHPDSARALLSTIAGGTISLMVFSFTMVMVVFNQTASMYSPRVIPTLIRRRFHQVIMGVYLGTIACSFMVLSSIASEAYTFDVPLLSVVITALLSLVCLALFITFIHSISQNIQIGEIISKVYEETLENLDREIKNKNCLQLHELPAMHQWDTVYSPLAGYLDGIHHLLLVKRLQRLNVRIKMLVVVGRFVNRGDAFFYVSSRISDAEQEEIFQAFVFRNQEIIKENYIYGFKHLTEIAMKALSPGINDPATAIQAIDRLSDLFVKRMEFSRFPFLTDKEGQLRFIYQPASLEDLFYLCFSSIKNYAGSNVPVMLKLLYMIRTLAQNDQEGKLTALLLTAVRDAVEQFTPDFRSASDKRRFAQCVEEFNTFYAGYPEMEKICRQAEALKV